MAEEGASSGTLHIEDIAAEVKRQLLEKDYDVDAVKGRWHHKTIFAK